MTPPRYYAFLLRIWQIAAPEEPGERLPGSGRLPAGWRASLEDPHTRQATGFDSLEALIAYLQSLVDAAAEDELRMTDHK